MTSEDIKLIQHVRRAYPRNPVLLALCELAERNVTKPIETLQCPKCNATAAKTRERVRRHRSKSGTISDTPNLPIGDTHADQSGPILEEQRNPDQR